MKIGTDFSGIGSPEMAIKELGIKHSIEFACEIDKYARKSYEAIHGQPKKFYNDITKRDHSEVPQLDLYVAGFPCQSFSMAGKRKGFDEVRGTLFFNVADFIRINQPKYFILENVKGLLSHDAGKTFQTILSILTDNGGTINNQMSIPYFDDGLGYHLYWQVLNTKEYGIPQNRERVFLVGFKDFRKYQFPKPFPLKLRLKDVLESEVDEKYYLSDKMVKCLINPNKSFEGIFKPDEGNGLANCLTSRYHKMSPTDTFIKEGYINQDTQASQVYNADGISPALNAGTHGYAQGYLKVNSATKKGYEEAKEGDSINFSVPNSKTRRGRVGKGVAQTLDAACNQAVIAAMRGRNPENPNDRTTGAPTEQRLEINKSGTSNSITTVQKDNLVLTERIRRLTPLECWRLQGFSDEAFQKAQKVNSDTQLYKQAGNSITVDVIKKTIKNVFN